MLISGIVYYSVLAFMTVIYLRHRQKNFGICDAVIGSSWILCAIGGWYCSYGYVGGSFLVFRPRVYLCYILYVVIVVFGFLVGKRIKVQQFRHIVTDSVVKQRVIWIIFTVIALYSILFFIFIRDNIPLLNLLKSGNVSDATISRLQTTHNIEENYSLPFIFRYRKLIMETPLYFLLGVSYISYLRYRNCRIQFFTILVFTAFCHSFTLEKSGIVNIAILLLVNYILYTSTCGIKKTKKQKRKIIKLVISIIALIIFTYWLFMGQKSFSLIIESVIQRLLMRQTGYIYYHDIALEMKYGGCLYGGEIPVFILDSIFHRNLVSLSSEVYSLVSNAYSSLGYVGTTGTMPLFYFISNLGYILGCIVFFILSVITSYIDKKMSGIMERTKGDALTISIYATMMLLFYQAFISNLTAVYMLPFIFSPQMIILWFCVKVVRILNK